MYLNTNHFDTFKHLFSSTWTKYGSIAYHLDQSNLLLADPVHVLFNFYFFLKTAQSKVFDELLLINEVENLSNGGVFFFFLFHQSTV